MSPAAPEIFSGTASTLYKITSERQLLPDYSINIANAVAQKETTHKPLVKSKRRSFPHRIFYKFYQLRQNVKIGNIEDKSINQINNEFIIYTIAI